MIVIQSERISTSEKIGSIGGTLGLFTGFSFLAAVEMIYWAITTLVRAFVKK